jgi:endonuclease/exonuclease/phosphatase family metal-dependent hydrolase
VQTAVLVVATGLVALLLVHRLSGVLGGVPGVVVLAVLPWLVVPVLLVPVVSLVLGRWWTGGVGAVLAVGLLLVLARRGLRAGAAPTGGAQLRLMTVNLYLGRADASAVVDLVRVHAVDVLSLQELTPAEVARLDAAGLAELLPHRVLDARPQGYGSGICSRVPLTGLPGLEGFRCAVPRARVRLSEGRELEVTAVHLAAPVDRARTARWVLEAGLLERHGGSGPSVLAGDFNATLDHPPLRRLLRAGHCDAAATVGAGWRTTWRQPGVAPPLTIDHVLLRGAVRARSVRVVPVAGSDHHAVVVELVLD